MMGEKKTIDSRTRGRIRPSVKPQVRDPSNKVPTSKNFTRSNGLSISSKIRLLCSYKINHMRHANTIFQIFENCFPNQFLKANNREVQSWASPTESQTTKNLHSIEHAHKVTVEQKMVHSFPHHIYTSNQLTS